MESRVQPTGFRKLCPFSHTPTGVSCPVAISSAGKCNSPASADPDPEQDAQNRQYLPDFQSGGMIHDPNVVRFVLRRCWFWSDCFR